MEAPRQPQSPQHTDQQQNAHHAAIKKHAESAASAVGEEKESLLANRDDAFDVARASRDEVGTIVTDKRRKRQSFFGVIKDAANEWTDEKAETVKGLEVFQKPEVPKVAPGSERKDIIEKAVATPRAQAQDDHKVVMERIKTFQQDAERVTGRPFIMKKDAGKAPTWSHIVGGEEPQEQPLPTAGKKFPQVQHIHREDVTSQSHNQSIAPTVRTRSEVTLPQAPAPEEQPSPTSVAPTPTAPVAEKAAPPPPPQRATPAPAPVPQQQAPVPQPAAPAPTFTRTPIVTPRQTPEASSSKPAPAPTPASVPNGLGRAVMFVSLIVILFAGIGSGAYYSLVMREPVVAGVVVPSFLRADAREALPLPNTRETLLQNLSGTIDASGAEFLHVYFIFQSDEDTETLATSADVFGVLAPRVSSAFIRSLDERMMHGGVRSAGTMEPFILVKSNAFDTAFAGMLEWEAFMSADLAPLFGEPVARSFNPDARTDDRTTRLAFVDRVVENHNVRVLYDESGNERITYGFVNRNTIILTSTHAAFAKIVDALE